MPNKPQDPTPVASSTQGRPVVIQPLDILANPLEYLVMGVVDAQQLAELTQLGTEIDPDVTFGRMEWLLQSLEERGGILLPLFWKDSPETFLSLMRDSIAPTLTRRGATQAERQYAILEALLSIRAEHPSGLLT
jgi:hypothetical protein